MNYQSKLSELEKLILKYPQKEWSWHNISLNNTISLQFIIDNPDLPWNLFQ